MKLKKRIVKVFKSISLENVTTKEFLQQMNNQSRVDTKKIFECLTEICDYLEQDKIG